MDNEKLDSLRIEREPEKDAAPAGRWIFITIAIAAVAVAGWFFLRPAPLPEVTTEQASKVSGEVAGTVLNASGYVTARRRATVSSKFTGRVTDVLIEEGMSVEVGQVLARLDTSNLNTSYELAEAQLNASRTSVNETRALLKEARASFDRTSNLVERQLASQAELDRVRAISESLSAQLERKQADVVVSEKALQVWAQQLEDTIIRAPFAGIIVSKNAQPGEMISPVSAGGGFTRTGIGTIVDMASLEIEIDVNEAYINRVTPGQQVIATLDAYPDWRIPCHVIATIPTADRQRATVEVRVGFDELDPRILPDMGVKVAFQESGQQESPQGGVVVSRSAVEEDNGKAYVLLLRNGVVERRAVSLGGDRGSKVLVIGGLSDGEEVITGNRDGLTDGTQVRKKENQKGK